MLLSQLFNSCSTNQKKKATYSQKNKVAVYIVKNPLKPIDRMVNVQIVYVIGC